MNELVDFLLLAVGLAVGILIALLIDGRILGQQLTAAANENRRLQSKRRAVASRLAAAQTQVARLTQDLQETTAQIEKLTQTSQTQARELTAVTAAKEVVYAQFHTLSDQLEKLRDEHQLTCRRLAVAAVELKHLQQDLDKTQEQSQQLIALQAEKQMLEARISDAKARLEAAQHQRNAAGLKGKSQIEIVRGIGPTYARRLHEAGVYNLTDLSRLTADRVGEIVGLKTWQRADPQAWIDEARQLASAFNNGDSA